MVRIRMTPRLAGALGELYYKEFCDQHGWAYLSLEQINKNKIQNGILEFKKGFERIPVKIPDEIKEEIERISKPYQISELNPSYVFDFLACNIGKWTKPESINVREKNDFCWVEVKTGEGGLSDNQVNTLKRITLDFALFYIEEINNRPNYIEIEWDKSSPQEWLEEIKGQDHDSH